MCPLSSADVNIFSSEFTSFCDIEKCKQKLDFNIIFEAPIVRNYLD